MSIPVWFSSLRPKFQAAGRLLLTLSAGVFPIAAQAESGAYVPYSGIIHGTRGADPVEVSILNRTAGRLECTASLAHWYSDALGQLEAGQSLTVVFWHDSATGVLNLMNATNDRMPVETVWCATQTARARLDLPMTAGKAKASLRFTCAARADATLTCEALDG